MNEGYGVVGWRVVAGWGLGVRGGGGCGQQSNQGTLGGGRSIGDQNGGWGKEFGESSPLSEKTR